MSHHCCVHRIRQDSDVHGVRRPTSRKRNHRSVMVPGVIDVPFAPRGAGQVEILLVWFRHSLARRERGDVAKCRTA